MDRLNEKTIRRAIEAGETVKLKDGQSLYLYVRGGSAMWVYQYRDGQSMRSRSLGSYPDLSPNAARKERERFAVRRRSERIERRGLAIRLSADPATDPASATIKRSRFSECVEGFIKVNAPNWKVNSKEPEKYRKLKDGKLGATWVDEIHQTAVEKELLGRWGHALASADKYRIRIMQVIDYAVAKRFRPDGPNPSRKEIMKHLIASAPASVPHKAMHRDEVPALMANLVEDGSADARSLAFLILTATRTAEARDADWSEIEGNIWTIPGGKGERSMKESKEHIVPLSPEALALLGKRKKSGRIFGDLAHDALIDKLRELRGEGPTVHGMRTSFTGWAVANGYSKDLRDRALAHAVGTKTDQAYDRESLADERRPMMQQWAAFATSNL